jgi:hypothetical protein
MSKAHPYPTNQYKSNVQFKLRSRAHMLRSIEILPMSRAILTACADILALPTEIPTDY